MTIQKHWLFLLLAIILEVSGTTLMKFNLENHPALGLAIMFSCLGLSYYALAKATRTLPIGVAYAIWEAAGLVLIVLLGILFLHESLDARKVLGLALIMSGAVIVHHCTGQHSEKVEA